MSGGVDSSVAARLLLEEGYEDLRPVYMRNWDSLDESDMSGGCEWERDWADVQRVCRQSLGGIVPQLVDLSKEYWSDVFQPALDLWSAALTPNPDVTCNRFIKFAALPRRLLLDEGESWIATGHYARLFQSPIDSTRPALMRGAYDRKDQSYYLSQAPIETLKRTMFPLGHLTKPQVRELARKWDIPTSEREESMGICFVGEKRNFATFLDSYLAAKPGPIQTEDGRVVGQHSGLHRYTIGEGARVGGMRERMFIARKDVERNAIVIAPASSPLLECTSMLATDFKWLDPSHPPAECQTSDGFKATAQTRSLPFGATAPCTVHLRQEETEDATTYHVRLQDPIRGVAPGQFVVLYLGEWCLGGGMISRTTNLADEQARASS